MDPITDFKPNLSGYVTTLGIVFTFWGTKPGEIYVDSAIMEVGERSLDVMTTDLLNDVENLRASLSQSTKQGHSRATPN
jgi:hypothetical protein